MGKWDFLKKALFWNLIIDLLREAGALKKKKDKDATGPDPEEKPPEKEPSVDDFS